MAQIHFEVDDELHRAIKLRAVGQGETIREAGGRLFRWYVDGTDANLVALCQSVVETVDAIMDFGERSCPFCGHHHIHTDESNIGTGDREYERRVCPYPQLKVALADAAREQGGEEE